MGVAREGEEWSDTEVRAVVEDYLAMLSAEAAGQHYSKAEHRRLLLPKLNSHRTPQAIEFKHANISAVMIELGLPYIRGYKPRGNYQTELETEILRALEDRQRLTALPVAPTAAPIDGLQRTDPPPPPPRKRVGGRVDYGQLQEENRRRGALGEQLVVAFEQRHLRESGHPDLADRVRWVARDDGDCLGYDVLSFDVAGGERHIEVKTTALGAQTSFYISSAELEFARSHPMSFALYRVYDVLDSPRFYVLEGDVSQARRADTYGLPCAADRQPPVRRPLIYRCSCTHQPCWQTASSQAEAINPFILWHRVAIRLTMPISHRHVRTEPSLYSTDVPRSGGVIGSRVGLRSPLAILWQLRES